MEQNWIRALLADREEVLAEVIGHFSGYVYTIVRNFSKGKLSVQDMEEITADVFICLWKNRKNLQADKALSPFLAAIARNLVKNRFRSFGKHPPVRQSYEELVLPDTQDLCGMAEQMEMIACLVEGMDVLTDSDRQLVVRFYFYGEKASEIAQKMGLTDAAVRVRLHRSRGKLRTYMQERGFDNV